MLYLLILEKGCRSTKIDVPHTRKRSAAPPGLDGTHHGSAENIKSGGPLVLTAGQQGHGCPRFS